MSLAPGPLLAGRITVVTGAAMGVGRSIACAFGAHGATVVIADRDTGGLERTADGIAAAGGKVIPVVADVTRPADVARLTDLAGEVDVLVNNLGPGPAIAGAFVDSSEEEWQALYRSNLQPVLLCCRAIIPGMILRRRGGSVINLVRDEATPYHVVDSAVQGGVSRFTRSLALELQGHRIRLNAIRVPAARSGEDHDLAGVALFLASDLSAEVSGTSIAALQD